MTEQDKKKSNKLHTFGHILRWIGLILLSILIILALFFQAPWKVITLLLIVLAACTILPKPAIKWFWLSVAAIVLILIIWVFLPEDDEGWRPYTFDEELAALEAKYAIPDSENAALIYNELLESYDANDFEPNFTDPNIFRLTESQPWSTTDNPEVADWLKGHELTMDRLMEACRKEKCRFPIIADTFDLGEQMERFGSMRNWARLLVRAGNNDMAEGRIEEGLEKYLCVGRMGDHMRQQSSITEILVGMAVEDLALGRLKAFVVTADATEEHLSLIEKAVADIKYEWTSDLPRILDCEKLMAKNLMCNMAYEVNSEGRTRFSRDPYAIVRHQLKERLDANQISDQEEMKLRSHTYPTYWKKKCIKAGTILGWFFMPSTPQKAGDIIDGGYEQLYAMFEPDFDWQREPPDPFSFLTSWNFTRIRFDFGFFAKWLVSMSEGSFYWIHDLYLRNIAEQRGNQLIIALRRYKNKTSRWPESLDDIKSLAPAEIFVDPINGNSFVYKLTEENFTLYSKGKNNIDEDGIRRVTVDPNDFIWPKTEEDDILIWQPKTRKTKEEKAVAE